MAVEASGPPDNVSQIYFLDDRNKICKKLMGMFKHFVSQMEAPSVTLVRKLRLYGVQFYDGTVYVYSLSKPSDHNYFLLRKDSKFNCLVQSTLLRNLIYFNSF